MIDAARLLKHFDSFSLSFSLSLSLSLFFYLSVFPISSAAIFSRRDDQDSVTGQFNLFVVIITSWLNSGESIVPQLRPTGV